MHVADIPSPIFLIHLHLHRNIIYRTTKLSQVRTISVLEGLVENKTGIK